MREMVLACLLAGSLAMGCAAKTKTGEDTMSESAVLKQAAGLTVRNADGESIAAEDLWAKGPVVLVFLRHFG